MGFSVASLFPADQRPQVIAINVAHRPQLCSSSKPTRTTCWSRTGLRGREDHQAAEIGDHAVGSHAQAGAAPVLDRVRHLFSTFKPPALPQISATTRIYRIADAATVARRRDTWARNHRRPRARRWRTEAVEEGADAGGLKRGLLKIEPTRVVVDGRVHESTPGTKAGRRTNRTARRDLGWPSPAAPGETG